MKPLAFFLTFLIAVSAHAQLPTASPARAGFDPARAREYKRWSESGHGFSFRREGPFEGFGFGGSGGRSRRRAAEEEEPAPAPAPPPKEAEAEAEDSPRSAWPRAAPAPASPPSTPRREISSWLISP